MDFPLKWSLLCGGEGGAGGERRRKRQRRTDSIRQTIEKGLQRTREEEISEESEKDIQGQRSTDGTRLHPHQKGKKGTNQWLLLSIQRSINHLIASQPGLQNRVYNYLTIDQTGHTNTHREKHTQGESMIHSASQFAMFFFG